MPTGTALRMRRDTSSSQRRPQPRVRGHQGRAGLYANWLALLALLADAGHNFGNVVGLSGRLALVETAAHAGGKYVELAAREKLFRTQAWPHVALADGRIYCRDRGRSVTR